MIEIRQFIGNDALKSLEDFLNDFKIDIIHIDTTDKNYVVIIYKQKL